ncbi:MAG TPA: NADH-quinone oxidoreductase subunit C/D, partial [Pseudomonadales bacterium]|nr:NADH-quinone oxidoreductase subunit C/D [Pseudomonadales bacterium]
MTTEAPASQSVPGTEYEVVRELYAQFGDLAVKFQPTKDAVPTVWVAREKAIEVLGFLRKLPR